MQLTPLQIEMLGELAGRGLVLAARALDAVAGPRVALSLDQWRLRTLDQARLSLASTGACAIPAVRLSFSGAVAGSATLALPAGAAARLAALITGAPETDDELDGIRAGTLAEVGGLVLCGALRPLSSLFAHPLALLPPHFIQTTPENLLSEAAVLSGRIRLGVGSRLVEGELFIETDRNGTAALAAALDRRAAPYCQYA